MVIRTEYRSQRYSMGSSDPLPVGFKIRFGSLVFQATGNGYLMRITNRDERHPWWSIGRAQFPLRPLQTLQHPLRRMLRVLRYLDADDVLGSAHARREWSDVGPRALRCVATSHRYAEWDFSVVPDPVMFQRFLDAVDYWFGCSDDSSTGSYEPACECFMVVVDDQAGDGEAPKTGAERTPEPGAKRTSHLATGGMFINVKLALARELKAKLADEYRAVRLLCASIAGEALARGERVRELGKKAHERINADFNVDDPNTPPRVSQKLIAAVTLLWAMPAPSTPVVKSCTTRRRPSSSRRPCNRPKARHTTYASRAVCEMTAVPKSKRRPCMWAAWRGNQPTRAER
jgi:hypothetical protein